MKHEKQDSTYSPEDVYAAHTIAYTATCKTEIGATMCGYTYKY